MPVLTLSINAKDNTSNAITSVGKSFQVLGKSVETTKNVLKSAAASAFEFTKFSLGIGQIVDIIGKVTNGLENMFSSVGGDAKAQWDQFKNTFNQISKIVTSVFVPALSSVMKAVNGFINSSKGMDIIINIASNVAGVLTIVKDVFFAIFDVVKNTLMSAIEDLSKNFKQTSEEGDNLAGILDFVKGAVVFLSVAFNVAINIVKNMIQAFINLASVVGEVGKLVYQFFTGQWGKIGETFDNLRNKIGKLASDAVNGFGSIIDSAKKTAEEVNKNFDTKKIASNFKKTSEDFKKTAKDMVKQSQEATQQQTNDAKKEMVIFNAALKKLYEEYKLLQEQVRNKQAKDEQDFFNKKMRLQELASMEGIRLLEEYYEKAEEKLEEELKFTEELKQQYLKYVELKKQIENNQIKDAQEYFDKLSQLRKLESVKGIKELEAFYGKSKEVVQKQSFLKIDISGFIVGTQNAFSEMTKNITQQLNNAFNEIGDLIKNKKFENKWQKALEVMSVSLKVFGEMTKSVFEAIGNYFSGLLEKVRNKWDNILKKIELRYQKNVAEIDKQVKEKLKILGLAEKTELEKAQEKLENLRRLQQQSYDEEVANRLKYLDDYYQSLDNLTDYEIQQAYERQKAKILETELKRQQDLAEQISVQEKEVKKLQILDEAEKQKQLLLEQYEAEKAAAEKRRMKELDNIQRQAFEVDKANKIAQVWISTAAGVAAAWASSMALMFPANVITAGILTGLLLTNAGIQTGLIAAQKYTPKNFATGGVIVGEAGPELIELPRGSRIYNNDQTERMLENQEINIINNIFIDSEKITEILIKKRLKLGVRGV